MEAALLINTSSAIHASFALNIGQQTCACRIEFGFFAQNGGLEQRRLDIFRLPTLAGGDDLILHDGGRGAQIEQVDRAVC